MANGFERLGAAILGGDVDREGAFLEGLDQGSQIQQRRAQTANAIAQARLRVDEAQQRAALADAADELGVDPAFTTFLRAGVNPRQATGAQGDLQQQGLRSTIADTGVPFESRQAAAQAIEGRVVDPVQFGPGGELFVDVFQPEGPVVSPTGTAAIAADEARAAESLADAALADARRESPERFRSGTTVNVGAAQQAFDQALDETEGALNLPENAPPAFGVAGAAGQVTNTIFDTLGIDQPFADLDQTVTAVNALENATLNTAVLEFPGRPTNFIAERAQALFPTAASLFQGEGNAIQKVRSLRDMIQREFDIQSRLLRAGVFENRSTRDRARASAVQLRQLLADYNQFIDFFEQSRGEQRAQQGAQQSARDLEVGQTITVNGATVTRVN